MSKGLLKTLLLISSFALYFLGIKPLYTGVGGVMQPAQSIQILRSLNSQYDQTLSKADNLVVQAEELRAQYDRVSIDNKEKMAIMVPESIDKVRLLSEVRGIAEDAKFALTDLTYTEGSYLVGSRGSVSISFSVKTTYPLFKTLMNNFEKSMRLFSIESVSFTAPEKGGELMTFQVKLQTYYLK